MAQEFFINSQQLQDKVDQLLPSQGGLGAGFDLSASTQIIPVVDLTESAEGSSLRADLQTAFSFSSITSNNFNNSTVTLITNTGFFRVFGEITFTGGGNVAFKLSDGATTKNLISYNSLSANTVNPLFDFNVFLKAGDSFSGASNSSTANVSVSTRQIADVDGNLVNP